MASVYSQNESLKHLYEDIMNLHWTFLDADESNEKIELRKGLEDLILKYLCNVPHNQKFLLTPTVHVLENSIAKLEDFSTCKAAKGFEAISQYANNLFTKPWRKEYKVIKMYSGFYQYEIAANLIGAETLFEQMGYRTMPNQTLVLDGPVCPDRVTNVSRDAITAYVECQIMKDIFLELTKMTLEVNWSDIYSFRECNTMNVMQSVGQMAALIHEKHQKIQQAARAESYGSALAPAVSSCHQYQYHPHMQLQQQQHQMPAPHPSAMAFYPQQATQMPFYGPQSVYNSVPCSVHSQHPHSVYDYHHHNSYQSFLPTSPSQPQAPHPSSQSSVVPTHPPPALGVIPHSKSLDHYQDHNAAMYNLTACMQRHSIDQPFDYAAVSSASHYGGPMGMGPPTGTYDAVDSCNMSYNNHPYNVSGNRFPLPCNLSNNLGPCINGVPGKPNGNESFYQTSINGYQPMPSYYHHRSSSNGQVYGPQAQSHRHAADIYMNHSFDHTGSQTPTSILSKKKTSYDEYDVPSARHGGDLKNSGDIYTRDETSKERKKSDRSIKATDLLVDYECDMLPESLVERNQQQQQHQQRNPYLHHQTSRNSRQSDFDSYEDEQLHTGAIVRASNVNKRISSKNQDGIGSYEQWNYVFQNLEKQGYNKDLGERGDFLVDVDEEEYPEANTSRGSTMKRSNNDKLKGFKPKSADKVDGIRSSATKPIESAKQSRDNEKNEIASRTVHRPTSVQKVSKLSSISQVDNNQKANNTSGATMSNVNYGGTASRRSSVTQKVSTKENGNLANTSTSNSASGGGILVNHNNSSHTSSSTSGKKKTTSFDTAAATIINPEDGHRASNGLTGRSEWNCKYCTYLNPETRRICEMCSKSRDFNLNNGGTTTATSNGTATCV